ncbi:MAG: hypothetical protein N3B10_01295 [Armatimonadetes bacterium]|nr:hypothetical protein [Armatimonadota bacterium]
MLFKNLSLLEIHAIGLSQCSLTQLNERRIYSAKNFLLSEDGAQRNLQQLWAEAHSIGRKHPSTTLYSKDL